VDSEAIKAKLDTISSLIADLYVLTAVTPPSTSSPADPPITAPPITAPPIAASPVNGSTIVKIEDSDYIEFHGLNQYLAKEYLDQLTILMQQNIIQFPDRQFKKLYILDAGTSDGSDPPNHPIGTHCKGWAVDAKYFSLDGSFKIFGSDGTITENFDIKRALNFILAFIKVFPLCYIFMDDRIYLALWNLAAWSDKQILQDNVFKGLGHDTHIHLGYHGPR
jgi:hypothetical protein